MPQKTKKYTVCPCCSKQVDKCDVVLALAALEKHDRSIYQHYKELYIDHFQSLFNDIEWACDSCLTSKRAIKAIPQLQQTSGEPHIAYYDTPLVCSKCKQDFTFKKEEKQLWYERLKFEIHAQPDDCLTCRRETRKLKNQNNILTSILRKAESDLTREDLAMIISVYTEWGKEEKVKYYKSLTQKLEKRTT